MLDELNGLALKVLHMPQVSRSLASICFLTVDKAMLEWLDLTLVYTMLMCTGATKCHANGSFTLWDLSLT